ncbi:MAG: nucleotidyltransferase domain-containing protein [Acidobacteriaceae bacterium]
MIPEAKIQEFVKRVREAAGENLESVILYGSAASGDFDPEFSDINLFCVLRDSSFAQLSNLAPVARWWQQQKQRAPMIMTRAELESTTDVFAIEFQDMKLHHRVLTGDDVLENLVIPMELHRVQVEYELREKLLLLRQRALLAYGNKKQLQELLLASVPSFFTLFRHSLIALGQNPQEEKKREMIKRLGVACGMDATTMMQVLDLREHRSGIGQKDIEGLFGRYLAAIEQVTAAVDKALGPRSK